MTGKEIVNVIEWMRKHNHSDSEIVDFILFVESGRSEQSGDEDER